MSSQVWAVGYTITDLGSLGGTTSYAYGINASGQVVGLSYTTGNITAHAFITGANGIGMTDLGTLGGNFGRASGINASGQVTGWATTADGISHGFITGPNGIGMTDLGTNVTGFGINTSGQVAGGFYSPQGDYHAFISGANGMGITDLGTLGIWSQASGINASGQVVGFTGTQVVGPGNELHAFITGPNGVGMTDLSTLGGTYSVANGISASGQVVGVSKTTSDAALHAFISGSNGVGMTDLGTLGGINSVAYGINANGQVVGTSEAFFFSFGPPFQFGTQEHAFITGANGVGMTDLNTLVSLADGSYFNNAFGVNDMGQIIANTSNGHAYLLTPATVPVPTAAWLLGSGLLGLVGVVRRRKAA